MKQLKVSEIHHIALEILKDVADFCEKNHLEYFISCGTLLGAVRHGGFIPWDHDIDIDMPRDSYERFLSTYHTDKGYQIVSVYTHKHAAFSYAKVTDRNTTRSSDPKRQAPLGVNIDIFPLDSFVSEAQAKAIYNKIKPVKQIIASYKKINELSKPRATFLRLVKNRSVLNFLIRRADQRIGINQGKRGDFLSVLGAPSANEPEIFKRGELFPTKKEGTFEGHIFRIPNNAERYLTLLYGDYHKLPPMEQIRSVVLAPIYWIDQKERNI